MTCTEAPSRRLPNLRKLGVALIQERLDAADGASLFVELDKSGARYFSGSLCSLQSTLRCGKDFRLSLCDVGVYIASV